MQKVEGYKTSDGKFFTDFTEASVHEECCKYIPEIQAFMASDDCKYKNGPYKKVVFQSILSWLFWKADGGINS